MRANPLLGPILVLTVCFFIVPMARGQVDGCPESNCVQSQTSLVFNPQTSMMDAFTSATTDYSTAYWYEVCVDLAVVRLNGHNLANETVVFPSFTPPACVSGSVEAETSASVAATPGRQYAAFGSGELHVYFEYVDVVGYPTCGPYCDGYWYCQDVLNWSS